VVPPDLTYPDITCIPQIAYMERAGDFFGVYLAYSIYVKLLSDMQYLGYMKS